MRLAMKAEEERLAKMHTYVDNTKDLPLLTSNTLSIYESNEVAE
jgi:hypothetical protein